MSPRPHSVAKTNISVRSEFTKPQVVVAEAKATRARATTPAVEVERLMAADSGPNADVVRVPAEEVVAGEAAGFRSDEHQSAEGVLW